MGLDFGTKSDRLRDFSILNTAFCEFLLLQNQFENYSDAIFFINVTHLNSQNKFIHFSESHFLKQIFFFI